MSRLKRGLSQSLAIPQAPGWVTSLVTTPVVCFLRRERCGESALVLPNWAVDG